MAVPDQALYEQLKVGILKVFDMATSNAERHAIGQQLEAFKARPDAPQYGIHMARAEQDSKLYFFGLDVVSKAVKNRWHEYPEPQKASMRGFMLSMLADCTQYRFSQEHAGREKFAAALVEIVKRDWPQQWPDFQGAALHVMERGPIEASVVCKTLRVILEDVGDSDFNFSLPSNRKADIMRGLQDLAVQGLFAACQRLLGTVMEALRAPPNQETAARFSLAGNEILGVLARFLGSSMLSQFRGTQLIAAIAQAMRLEACRCIAAIAEGSGGSKTPDEKAVALMTLQELAPVLPELPLRPQPPLLDFHKALSRALSLLASSYFSHIIMPPTNSRNPRDAAGRHALLGALHALLQHPSLLVASITVPVWIAIASHDDATNEGLATKHLEVNACYLSVMETVAQRLVQPPAGSPQGPDSDYNLVDFVTTAEWRTFYTQFRGRLAVALRHATVRRPCTLVGALAAIGGAVQRRVSALAAGDVGADGNFTEESEPARLLEAFSTFNDAVAGGLPFTILKSKPPAAARGGRRPKKGKKKKGRQPPQPKGAPSVDRDAGIDEATYHDTRRGLGMVTQTLLSLDARCATAVRLQCKSLGSLSKFLQSDASLLVAAAQLCAKSVLFRSTQESKDSLPVSRMYGSTLIARRAALSALRALCTGSPASLVKEYDGLASSMLRAGQEGRLLAAENTIVTEFLVLLANAIPDSARRTDALRALIQAPIEKAAALYGRLASPDALLGEMGAFAGGAGLEGRAHRAQQRAQLLATLAGCEAIIRQLQLRGSQEAAALLQHMWPMVLPGALRMLGAYCFLWEPSKRAELMRTPASAGLFVLSRSTVRALAGTVDDVEDAPEGWAGMVEALSGDTIAPDSAVLRGADPGNEAEVAAVADWTGKFLSTALSMIRAACVSRKGRPAPAFLSPDFTSGIRALMEPALGSISHAQLRTVLINVYLPVLIACPAERVQDTLVPMLQPVIDMLVARVQEVWKHRNSGTQPATAPMLPPHVEEEARAVVLSNADLELTRFAMELCAVLCGCDASDTPSIARVSPVENADPRVRAMALSNPAIAQSALRMLLGAFQVPDHAAARTAITAMHKLLKDPGTHAPLAEFWSELFQQSVMALVKPPKHLRPCQWPLLHLAKDIYQHLCLGLKPKPGKKPAAGPILTDAPRRVLLETARVPEGAVRTMEQTMRQSGQEKKVRDAFKDALQSAMDAGLAQAVGADAGDAKHGDVLKVTAEGHTSIRDLPDKYVMMSGNHERAPAVLDDPRMTGGEMSRLFYTDDDDDDDDDL